MGEGLSNRSENGTNWDEQYLEAQRDAAQQIVPPEEKELTPAGTPPAERRKFTLTEKEKAEAQKKEEDLRKSVRARNAVLKKSKKAK